MKYSSCLEKEISIYIDRSDILRNDTVSPKNKRYLSDRDRSYDTFITAAKDYVKKTGIEGRKYGYLKPYDPTPGNSMYYINMYDILNLLKAMNIKSFGRILEVGCGAGWLSEILMALGYTVDAIEPCEDFIEIAKERVGSFANHLHISDPPKVTFYNTTLEECCLPEGMYDAIIFYAALHHIVDEEKGLDQCFRLLKPGGCLGIHEGAWIPGNREIEKTIDDEMKKYGTLENPFTVEYLDYLLKRSGFLQIDRYHQVNGLFPASMGDRSVRQTAQALAEGNNIIIAVKPYTTMPTTADPDANTQVRIVLLEKSFDPGDRLLKLKVKLQNTGDTVWLDRMNYNGGWISIALHQKYGPKKIFREPSNRCHLPEAVLPGKDATIDVSYKLPEDYGSDPWYLDLVNEGYFWFSSRGSEPLKIILI